MTVFIEWPVTYTCMWVSVTTQVFSFILFSLHKAVSALLPLFFQVRTCFTSYWILFLTSLDCYTIRCLFISFTLIDDGRWLSRMVVERTACLVTIARVSLIYLYPFSLIDNGQCLSRMDMKCVFGYYSVSYLCKPLLC